MDWHTQPQLSYIKMRLHSGELPGKRLLCDLPLHIIQHSEVCSVCTKHSKLFHISFIGFIPYCNERGKAIKLFPYKNQSLSSVLGQVHWHYNLTNIHQRGLQQAILLHRCALKSGTPVYCHKSIQYLQHSVTHLITIKVLSWDYMGEERKTWGNPMYHPLSFLN